MARKKIINIKGFEISFDSKGLFNFMVHSIVFSGLLCILTMLLIASITNSTDYILYGLFTFLIVPTIMFYIMCNDECVECKLANNCKAYKEQQHLLKIKKLEEEEKEARAATKVELEKEIKRLQEYIISLKTFKNVDVVKQEITNTIKKIQIYEDFIKNKN